jgi:VanZ family protein
VNRFVWDDAWTGEDKKDHWNAGLYISAGLAVVLGLALPIKVLPAVLIAAAAGVAAAIGKEVYDLFAPGRTPSLQDGLATAAGALVGAMAGGGVLSILNSLRTLA